jgi:PII-like signaling protein
MPPYEPARLLQAHISGRDRHGKRPVWEALVQTCREMGIAGATVFRGAGRDDPVIVTVVDSAEKIATLAAAFEPMIESGAVVIEDVMARRVRRPPPDSTGPAPPRRS